MKKRSKTPRFDVDYKERLAQRKTASDAVRLPRLGYALYRVYDVEKTREPRGVSKGTLNGMYGSVGTGKSSYNITVQKSRQGNKTNWQQLLWAFINEAEVKAELPYDVRWLKPKHVTLLQMKGHCVESAQPADKPGRVTPFKNPVSLGA